MAFEMAGARILGPYFGISVFVWSALIGIILGSLSIGYWLGGKIADKRPTYKMLSLVIFFSAIAVGIVAVIKNDVLLFLQQNIESIKVNSVVASIILFSIPGVLLGMVSPYAAKLRVDDLKVSGATIGNLYAISTFGSIVGTFLGGFYLIPFFGVTKIIFILAVVLVLTSILAAPKELLGIKTATAVIFILSIGVANVIKANSNVLEFETQYNTVQVYDSQDYTTERKIKNMRINSNYSSAMFLDSDELVFDYAKCYGLMEFFVPEFEEVLMIGGAAYSYPKAFLNDYPDAKIDVVEIDPGLTEIAKEHFRLKDDKRLRIIHEDGRIFLDRTSKKYDVVLSDVFKSFSIPFHLTTKEYAQSVYDSLSDEGVAILNILSAVEGEKGQFLRAEYKTYKTVFPQVLIFSVYESERGDHFQNLIMVALKSDEPVDLQRADPKFKELLSHIWKKPIADDVPILTDEYAPVDYYANKIMEDYL